MDPIPSFLRLLSYIPYIYFLYKQLVTYYCELEATHIRIPL